MIKYNKNNFSTKKLNKGIKNEMKNKKDLDELNLLYSEIFNKILKEFNRISISSLYIKATITNNNNNYYNNTSTSIRIIEKKKKVKINKIIEIINIENYKKYNKIKSIKKKNEIFINNKSSLKKENEYLEMCLIY